MSDSKLNFEAALSRLETIAKLLETGDAPLEEAMALYEEGVALTRALNQKLETAQQKITRLQPEEAKGDAE